MRAVLKVAFFDRVKGIFTGRKPSPAVLAVPADEDDPLDRPDEQYAMPSVAPRDNIIKDGDAYLGEGVGKEIDLAGLGLTDLADSDAGADDDFDISKYAKAIDDIDENDPTGGLSDDELASFMDKKMRIDEIAANDKILNDPKFVDAGDDDELTALLKRDAEASQELTFATEDELNYIKNEDIYDNVERPEGEISASEMGRIMNQDVVDAGDTATDSAAAAALRPKKKGGGAMIFLYVLTGFCFVAVAGALIFIFTVTNGLNASTANATEAPTPAPFYLTQPDLLYNNDNYIYLNTSKEFEGKRLTLEKMLTDSVETAFWFNRELDPDKYLITLSDERSRAYPPNMINDFAGPLQPRGKTFASFSPLREGTGGFTTTVTNISTGESASFTFEFKDPLQSVPASYIDDPVKSVLYGKTVELWVDSVTFSTGATTVNFSTFPVTEGCSLTPGDNFKITMREGSVLMSELMRSPFVVSFDNDISVGLMRFAPVKDLTKQISLTFSGLYKNIPLGVDIPATGLFAEQGETINVGEVDVVIEKLVNNSSQSFLYMTAHGVNRRVRPDRKYFWRNRTEIVLDATLTITTPDGDYVIQGECQSAFFGTDVRFRYDGNDEIIKKARRDDITINIKAVTFAAEDVTIRVNASSDSPGAAGTIRDGLEWAFGQRLNYRSGIAEINTLEPLFDESILTDPAAMAAYQPGKMPASGVMTGAQTLSAAERRRVVYALVADIWESGGERFSALHLVTAAAENGQYKVISDEVLATK